MTSTEADSQPLCPYCGHADLVDGYPRGQHRTRFVPTGKLIFRSAPKVRATACMGCGGLWMWVEPAEVAKALGKDPL